MSNFNHKLSILCALVGAACLLVFFVMTFGSWKTLALIAGLVAFCVAVRNF